MEVSRVVTNVNSLPARARVPVHGVNVAILTAPRRTRKRRLSSAAAACVRGIAPGSLLLGEVQKERRHHPIFGLIRRMSACAAAAS